MDLDTTIVAVSSSSGNSSRALIRATGNRIFEAVQQLGVTPKNRRLAPCMLSLCEGTLPTLCMAYPASSSYTGQDTVEFSIPNNNYLITSVVKHIINATSGRHAEAGEFTARAFFNGRLSLSEAEGICGTISASNDSELQGAALLRKGALNKLVTPLSKEVSKTLSLVEAGIDFTEEEDVVAIPDEALLESIELVFQSVQKILDGKISMVTLQHLPQVVIAGKPNAGKSTLFNALLGHRRVVVSNKAGTTRDVIQEPVWFNSKEAILIDVAGIEKPTDSLSASVQDSTERTVVNADVVLWCIAPKDSAPPHLKNAIHVYTKSDLAGAQQEGSICAMTGVGITRLQHEVENLLTSVPSPSKDALALLPRHEQHLQSALVSLAQAKEIYSVPELCATSLRETLNALGSITGTVTPDEIIGEVFSSFCIGK